MSRLKHNIIITNRQSAKPLPVRIKGGQKALCFLLSILVIDNQYPTVSYS